ncbi:RNA polymerase sigma factor [Solitalea lacus]|uniref:RNA polymerase sigma factor n=1 Tax=Solitalea lacus TaxID=2911172 RepID=UPI001EDC1B34|nr:RNA polymerase sigma-70 factor [Solitalea lacus]UKJ07010.1 RNA polymerase sigma-70 factor [Solitalea lacus]
MALNPLPNESDLLAKIAGGDQRAFTILFNHYHHHLFIFSKKLSKSEEIALEIVQDVFLKVWTLRERLTELDNFGGYLTRIVRNHSLNVIRQIARKEKPSLNSSINSDDFVDTTIFDITQQKLDYNDSLKILNEALDLLAPQQRKVYQLCHIEGLKYEEAAHQMNISIETVRAHMKKALQKIREHFAKNAIFYPLLIITLFKSN